jgi:hypothetical protein
LVKEALMSAEPGAWQEIAERKIVKAPEGPGVIEVGRTPAWPETLVKTLYIGGTPTIRAALMTVLGARKGKFAGCQYFRYIEDHSYQELAKARVEMFVAANGEAPPIPE